MKIGKLSGLFCVLPSITIEWIYFFGERHYSVQISWLRWYVTTYKTPDEIINNYIKKI